MQHRVVGVTHVSTCWGLQSAAVLRKDIDGVPPFKGRARGGGGGGGASVPPPTISVIELRKKETKGGVTRGKIGSARTIPIACAAASIPTTLCAATAAAGGGVVIVIVIGIATFRPRRRPPFNSVGWCAIHLLFQPAFLAVLSEQACPVPVLALNVGVSAPFLAGFCSQCWFYYGLVGVWKPPFIVCKARSRKCRVH